MRRELATLTLALLLGSCNKTEPTAATPSPPPSSPAAVATKKPALSDAELKKLRGEIFKAYRDNIKHLSQADLKISDTGSMMDDITNIDINEAKDQGAFTFQDASPLSEVEMIRALLYTTQLLKTAFKSGDPVLVFSGDKGWIAKEEIVLKPGSKTGRDTYRSLISQVSDFMKDELKLDQSKEYSLTKVRNLMAEHANAEISGLEKKYP